MRKIIFSASLALLLLCAGSFANASPYLGGRADRIEVSVDGENISYGGIRVVGGYQLNESFAIEAHFGSGISDAKIDGQSSELGTYRGVDLIGKLPITESFYVKANLGYGSVEIDGISDNDARMGAGAGYRLSENADVALTVERLYSKDGITINSVNTGFSYKF